MSMEEVRGRTFTGGEKVETDGRSFVDCNFESASLCYSGGAHPTLEGCSFGQVGWYFEGEALRTVQFLQMLRNSPGGDGFIDDLFQPGKFIDA
jgi:hypothetical protein